MTKQKLQQRLENELEKAINTNDNMLKETIMGFMDDIIAIDKNDSKAISLMDENLSAIISSDNI